MECLKGKTRRLILKTESARELTHSAFEFKSRLSTTIDYVRDLLHVIATDYVLINWLKLIIFKSSQKDNQFERIVNLMLGNFLRHDEIIQLCDKYDSKQNSSVNYKEFIRAINRGNWLLERIKFLCRFNRLNLYQDSLSDGVVPLENNVTIKQAPARQIEVKKKIKPSNELEMIEWY